MRLLSLKLPFIQTALPERSNRTYPELDGLRAWAIISVVLAHLNLPAMAIVGLDQASDTLKFLLVILQNLPFLGYYGGAMGVNLFFIISGFLIYTSLTKKSHISFWSFMARRYQRLLPVHLVSVIPLLAISTVGIFGILANIFFLAELFISVQNVNILTWTMSYEIIFYMLCALWFIAGRKNKQIMSFKYLTVACILFFSTSYILTQTLADWQIKYIDPNFFSAFFFGICIAKLFLEHGKVWKRIEKYSLLIGCIGLGMACLYRFAWYYIIFLGKLGTIGIQMGYVLINCALSCVVVSILTKKDHSIKKFFRSSWLVAIGTISYSVYLTHFAYSIPLAAGLVLLFPNLVVRLLALQVFGLILSFGVGLFYFHYFEKPFVFIGKTTPIKKTFR